MVVSSHVRCRYCGRLLAPSEGRLPPHRRPVPQVYTGRHSVAPLTGKGEPWCVGGRAS